MKRYLLAALFFLTQACWAVDGGMPTIDKHIDPSKSFWTDHVHYPFPHHFAKVNDDQGRTWEIAYADLFRGDAAAKAKAPVLVMLHGRAMNSGAWGQLLEAPLAAGWRVVTIDWSNGGKSMPRNLHLPVIRSLEDSRRIVHNLVVKHLGIAKASYLGHSLGGQLAAGYALKFPENVERLVLYASGGLQSFSPIERNGVRMDDPTWAQRPEAFLAAWKSGAFPSMGSTEEQVERSFYAPVRPGSMAYLQRGAKLNEFIVGSRSGILRGNPQERDRFMQNYAAESVVSTSESRVEDADALPGRVSKLKVPTFVALGEKDPVVPVDVAKPLFLLAKSEKAPIKIKIYEKTGHFIHTDIPDRFSREVMDFLTSGTVAEPIYAGVEAPARTPLATLPPDIQRYKDRVEAAWVSRELERVRATFHPEFREDGQNLKERMEFIASFLSMITSLQMNIYDIKQEGEDVTLDMEARNNFGNFPMLSRLKKVDGEWRNYGNQR